MWKNRARWCIFKLNKLNEWIRIIISHHEFNIDTRQLSYFEAGKTMVIDIRLSTRHISIGFGRVLQLIHECNALFLWISRVLRRMNMTTVVYHLLQLRDRTQKKKGVDLQNSHAGISFHKDHIHMEGIPCIPGDRMESILVSLGQSGSRFNQQGFQAASPTEDWCHPWHGWGSSLAY